MNVLIIVGHPRNNSFAHALADAYKKGVEQAGLTWKAIDLASLSFNPHVITSSPNRQAPEPELEEAKQLLNWANHIVFVFPTWWGTMPAVLKGFIDRVFTSGFAFEETEGGTGYEPLLRGKTSHLITTMDTPRLVYKLFYRAPGINALKHATLGFCGIDVTRTRILTPIKDASLSKRDQWLNIVAADAAKLKTGARSGTQQATAKVLDWLKAIRLQFYPMAFIAYWLGAEAASAATGQFNTTVFVLGYMWLFFLEVATVLSNEYLDFDTDKRNNFYSMFSGGSRVLVTGQLTFKEMKTGIGVALGLSVASLMMVWQLAGLDAAVHAVFVAAVFILTLGYTIPPLKFSYRTLGEIDVAVTHSFVLLVSGYILQGGSLLKPEPWLLSLPLCLSILPSIILAGIPDAEADRQASKKTLAARFGTHKAATMALVATWLAVGTVWVYNWNSVLRNAFLFLDWFALAHAILLSWYIIKYLRSQSPPRRIDGLIIAALTYLIWFALIPLLNVR